MQEDRWQTLLQYHTYLQAQAQRLDPGSTAPASPDRGATYGRATNNTNDSSDSRESSFFLDTPSKFGLETLGDPTPNTTPGSVSEERRQTSSSKKRTQSSKKGAAYENETDPLLQRVGLLEVIRIRIVDNIRSRARTHYHQ
jgi:hypothetical protein